MLQNGRLNIYLDTDGTSDQNITATSDLRDSKWHHVAAIKEDDLVKLYIDGVNEKEETITVDVDSGLSMRIGFCKDCGTSSLQGFVDEVRVWNVARTQFEIQADMHQELTGNEPGLIGYWPFNEGTGNIAFDLSTNNNDGTLHGLVMWVASSAPVLNWLSTTPSSGILSEGSSLDMTVIFNTDSLSAGSYDAAIEISSKMIHSIVL